MRSVDTHERRARLGLRHRLAVPAADAESVAADVVGLHSSDPVAVYLTARARVRDFAVTDLETALYERRSLVRMLGMRRTMFVVPVDLAAVMDAACTQSLAPGERKRLVQLLEVQGITDDGGRWIERVESATLDALAAAGEATATELTAKVPELATKLSFGEGRTWAGTVGLSTRILFLLATDGRIVRARPLGTWLSSQYRWSLVETWLGDGLDSVEPEAARVELVQRWLRSYGPGTLKDVKWWTGWTVAETKKALAGAGAIEVALEGGTGYLLPDDIDEVPEPEPWAALLPGLDPTVMGWKERDWYLGAWGPQLFDRNGNAGPTVWWQGRVVGGWSQRDGGEVVVGLLEDVGSDAGDRIDAEAERLTRWLDGTRVTPRFRTPFERSLTA